jgi:hypothetical protein
MIFSALARRRRCCLRSVCCCETCRTICSFSTISFWKFQIIFVGIIPVIVRYNNRQLWFRTNDNQNMIFGYPDVIISSRTKVTHFFIILWLIALSTNLFFQLFTNTKLWLNILNGVSGLSFCRYDNIHPDGLTVFFLFAFGVSLSGIHKLFAFT